MLKEGNDRSSLTSRQMRALELNAEYFGVSPIQLMENAGHNVALEVASRFGTDKTIAIFCGLGGNGGDGFVVARHLSAMGFKTTVILAGRAKEISHKAALKNWKTLQHLREGICIHEVYDSSLKPEIAANIIIDALLGTGTKGKLRLPIPQLVDRINSMNSFRLAVDVPTGIDADTGKVLGEAVRADLTITFHKTKRGLEAAKKYVGELVVKGIGLPEQIEKSVGPGDVLLIAKPRPRESHKGDFGRLLVIGGSDIFSGAPAMVALAALRTGVDLTYVAAPVKTAHAIASMSPNLITVKLEGEHLSMGNMSTLKEHMETADAVVLGPGLGLHTETREFVRGIIGVVEKAGKPLLLDADGLKAFSEFKRRLKAPLILTPHAGEYAVLTGRGLPENFDDRISKVRKTAAELAAVILLKGSTDIVSDGRRLKLNFTGNPGMTVGGTGDVLSGIVGAFLAQGVDPFEAAVAGAFISGAAGDFVFEEKGYHMVATDLIEWIPHVMKKPMSHLKVRRTGAKNS